MIAPIGAGEEAWALGIALLVGVESVAVWRTVLRPLGVGEAMDAVPVADTAAREMTLRGYAV